MTEGEPILDYIPDLLEPGNKDLITEGISHTQPSIFTSTAFPDGAAATTVNIKGLYAGIKGLIFVQNVDGSHRHAHQIVSRFARASTVFVYTTPLCLCW